MAPAPKRKVVVTIQILYNFTGCSSEASLLCGRSPEEMGMLGMCREMGVLTLAQPAIPGEVLDLCPSWLSLDGQNFVSKSSTKI